MIKALLEIVGAVVPHFSPEQMEKRKRKRIRELEDEISKLFEDGSAPRNRERVAKCMSDISRLRKELGD